MPDSLAAIRQLVHVAFSAEEFDAFCFDFFPAVKAEFTTGQSQSSRVGMLVEYAERQDQLNWLLAEVKRANLYQYDLYAQCPAVSMSDVRPYRGLEPFTEDENHARYYFGREETTDQLLRWLDGHNFVTLVGASGSGKSSLARAGLACRLNGGALPGPKWAIEFFRPGEDPLRRACAQPEHVDGAGAQPLGSHAGGSPVCG